MKLTDFDYNLPSELIAQFPTKNRGRSRLLLLNRSSGKIGHKSFSDLPELIKNGDLLVINNSKVFPARLFGWREDTRGKVEILLNKEIKTGIWQVIGKNVKAGTEIVFDNSALTAQVLSRKNEISEIKFNLSGEDFFREVDKIGIVPLPPYIKRDGKDTDDSKKYQTVYAKERGSVAAPTAGLHFTDGLIKALKNRGVIILELTLHVGLGTFAPVKEENITDHKIHSEWYSLSQKSYDKIIQAKNEGKRIIAVGTTTTRVLEHIFSINHKQSTTINDLFGWTDIFIYPGYTFKCIDGLITNFHLPKSTLLMLVSAFAGREKVMKSYDEAIKNNYRFYSYGDAMLII